MQMETVCKTACVLNDVYGKSVGFRISLQRPLDILKTLPVASSSATGGCQSNLNKSRLELEEVIGDLLKISDKAEKEQEVGHFSDQEGRETNLDSLWSRISCDMMSRKSEWEEVICKWQKRLRLQHSKAKSFNRTLWDQFDDIFNGDNDSYHHQDFGDYVGLFGAGDEDMVKNAVTSNFNGDIQECEESLDEAEYNDRNFYFMLLKSFVSRDNNSTLMQTSELRESDLQSLRKSKRMTTFVDTKSSKGRRLRYVSHPMLQNFMFPSARDARECMNDDTSKLISSLFK